MPLEVTEKKNEKRENDQKWNNRMTLKTWKCSSVLAKLQVTDRIGCFNRFFMNSFALLQDQLKQEMLHIFTIAVRTIMHAYIRNLK